MIIRTANMDEVYRISRLYAQSWKNAYIGIVPQTYLDRLREDAWVEKMKQHMAEGLFNYSIAVEGDEIVGCITHGKSSYEKQPVHCEIQSLYIHPDFFRKGIGTSLMNYAFAAIKKEGYQSVFLWVAEENQRAKRFYKKMGFRITKETIKIEIDGKVITDNMALIDLVPQK